MQRLAEAVRHLLQKTGFDLVHLRSTTALLTHQRISLVFDVGANIGQYALKLRHQGYQGKIVSFEPQSRVFAMLQSQAAKDERWTPVQSGLGSEDGATEINVYNDPCLSSVLTLDQTNPMFDTRVVARETIQIRRLDQVFDTYASPADRVFLKLDTQGFEPDILRGAKQSLPKIIGVQMEMSLTPFYARQTCLDEMIRLMRAKGFILWQIQRGIFDYQTDQEFEIDGIFLNEAHLPRAQKAGQPL